MIHMNLEPSFWLWKGEIPSYDCSPWTSLKLELFENPSNDLSWIIPEQKLGSNRIWALSENYYTATNNTEHLVGVGGKWTFVFDCLK